MIFDSVSCSYSAEFSFGLGSEFGSLPQDIKRGGNQAAMQHYHNEPLMLKISRWARLNPKHPEGSGVY